LPPGLRQGLWDSLAQSMAYQKARPRRGRILRILFRRSIKPLDAILGDMKVEEIAEAVAKLPADQLARFRRWFTAFEAGRTDHAEELDSAAAKLGRLAGRALADLKKRAKEP
jgi:hypothetical protein